MLVLGMFAGRGWLWADWRRGALVRRDDFFCADRPVAGLRDFDVMWLMVRLDVFEYPMMELWKAWIGDLVMLVVLKILLVVLIISESQVLEKYNNGKVRKDAMRQIGKNAWVPTNPHIFF